MSEKSPFEFPPSWGNAVALVVYFAIFTALQIGVALRYLQKWNVAIFLGLLVFLILEVLGSIAYLKLHYNSVTGPYYSLYVFAFTAGPIFFISSLHLCVGRLLQDIRVATVPHSFFRPSSRKYITACLFIDLLGLIFTIIGAAEADAKSYSAASSKPGFDVLAAAMAIQSCSVLILVVVGLEVTISFLRNTPAAESTNEAAPQAVNKRAFSEGGCKRPKFFIAFLSGLLLNALILLAWAITRAVDVAGGLDGPLRTPELLGAETILLFVGILVLTVLHPAIALRDTVHSSPEASGQV